MCCEDDVICCSLQHQGGTGLGGGADGRTLSSGGEMDLGAGPKTFGMTHGLWIYRNLMIHDGVSGVLVTSWKEKLQEAIEHQLELGGKGLREEDKWMMEVNLGDLSDGTGERECYWLLAIRATREHRRLIEQRQQQQQ